MKFALLACASIFLATAPAAALAGLKKNAPVKDGMHRIHPGEGDYLVILHGWTTGYDNMREARDYFRKAGYHVVSLRYPVRTTDPATLLRDHIKPGIAKHCTDPNRKIHFLTHSLGGLLLREYLKSDRPAKLGRVVMLAPPNNGIEIVDRLGDRRVFAKFFGPTALQLGTDEDSWPKRLGKADFPLGIIMGSTRRRVPYTSKILPGSDDGIVSLASGKLEGMQQLIELTAFHTKLPDETVALKQAQHFFENGEFAEAAEPSAQASSKDRLRWLKNFAPKKH